MTDHKEALHIYLNNDGKNGQTKDGENVYERYLILTNNKLQWEHDQSVKEISGLRSKLEEMEEEVDRSDKSRIYLKGMLKNFNEIRKWDESLNKLESRMYKGTKNDLIDYKQLLTRYFMMMIFFFCTVSGCCLAFFDSTVDFMIITSVFVSVAIGNNMIMNTIIVRSYTKEELEKKTILKDKGVVLKAQDYIHDFIDCQ